MFIKMDFICLITIKGSNLDPFMRVKVHLIFSTFLLWQRFKNLKLKKEKKL